MGGRNSGLTQNSFFALTYHIQSIKKSYWDRLQKYIQNLSVSHPLHYSTLYYHHLSGHFTRLQLIFMLLSWLSTVYFQHTSQFLKPMSDSVTPLLRTLQWPLSQVKVLTRAGKTLHNLSCPLHLPMLLPSLPHSGHWPPCSYLNKAGTLLPQDLCTGFSFCLKQSSLTTLHSNITLSVQHSLTILFQNLSIADNTSTSPKSFLIYFTP